MSYVLYIITAVTLCYLAYTVWVARGVPESVSETYYLLKEKAWMFQVVMMMNGFGLMPLWISQSKEHLTWVVFLACSGLCFVGCAPMFRLSLQGAVHYTSAAVCGVCAVLWVVLMGYYPTAVCCAFLAFLGWVRWKRYMWWIEMAVISMVYASIV